MLSFAYPWVFALLPLPWLVRRLFPPAQARQVAVRVPFGTRIRNATTDGDGQRPQAVPLRSLWLLVLVWLFVLAALARPQWIEPPITKTLPTRDLLLLVDLSSSMQKEDFTNAAGQQVDRLTAVKEVLGEFLQHREGDRVGLVVFGDAPYQPVDFRCFRGRIQRAASFGVRESF